MINIKSFLKKIVYRMRAEITTEQLVKDGLKVGKNFVRRHGVILDPSHCWLITIGDNVAIGARTHILAHDASSCAILGYCKIGRVNIGNNVFIGAESIILPNVNIGDNVVIGAGSVVSKDIPSGSVAVGNPAKVIMTYEEYSKRLEEKIKNCPVYDESYTLRNKKITNEQKEKMYRELDGTMGFVE